MVQRTLNGDENMNALIFNGSKDGDDSLRISQEAIETRLKEMGWQVDNLLLREMEIAPCLGCFGCWVKTPGICVIDDAGRDIVKKAVQSDLLIFLTPVTFGGYSSELKKAVDRLIQWILPFFTKVDGEIHHRPRYERYPIFISIGILPNEDKESERLFKDLVDRNAINFNSPAHAAGIITSDQDKEQVREEIKMFLSSVEVRE